MNPHHDIAKLEAFFYEVAKLTFYHDELGDYAVVYPSKLGAALEKVYPQWWKLFFDEINEVEGKIKK